MAPRGAGERPVVLGRANSTVCGVDCAVLPYVRVSVVLNREAGRAPAPDALAQALARGLPGAEVIEIARSVESGAFERAAAGADLLVAAGGDGTVSAVAAAAARTGRPFGVIPCGTLNHFARDMGIPAALDEAIAVIAAGHTRAIDTGDLNGRMFVNNASAGAYPRLVWERNRARRRGLPRPAAMGVAVARTWMGLRSDTVRLTVDGVALVRRTPFIFVGNSSYEVEGTEIGRRPVMTDGTLSLCMAPKFGRIDALLLPVRVLARTLERHERFETLTAELVVVRTGRPRVRVALDGEVRVFGGPLSFAVRRNAVTVVAP